MPITLDCKDSKLIIKVIPSDNFNFDRDRIKRIPTRRAIFDKESGIFQHWEVQRIEIGALLERFGESEIIPTDAGKEAIESYKQATIPLDQLDKIEGELEFEIAPKATQEEYIRLHPSKRKMILAYDPGLGKSAAALMRAKTLGFEKLVVILPKAIKDNWITQLQLFLDEGGVIYHGTPAQRKKLIKQAAESKIVITTTSFLPELEEFKWDAIIVDEAHIISRPQTLGHKSVKKVVKSNPEASLQLLTGTPVLHKLVDLWGLVHLVSEEIAGSRWAWEDRYQEVLQTVRKTLPNGKVIMIPTKTRTRNLTELRQRIAPILVRVSRKDVTAFKETTKIISVPMTERQKEMYEQVKAGIIVELEKEGFFNSAHALTRLLGLREVAEGLFNLDESWNDSGKFDFLCNVLDNTKEPVVIWSAFKEITNRIHARYPTRCVLYNGDVPASKKKLAPWAFQGCYTPEDLAEYARLKKLVGDWPFEPGEANIFAGTLDLRQGLGIDLDRAYIQYFSSFHWNMSVNTQAADRLHRLGQKATEVFTYYLTSEGTIEKKILRTIMDNYSKVVEMLDGKDSISSNQIQEFINLLKS
jgi:SNF2 family DNA or RNA helicase